MMKYIIVLCLFFSLFSTLSFAKISEIEVMSYNVENLFDTKHDTGKNDYAYLPQKNKLKKEECKKNNKGRYAKECLRTDWTEAALSQKLGQIKKVLTEGRSKLPELLAVSEIENESVAQQLAKLIGYKNFIVSDGPDKRGIDLALFYNETRELKKINHKEYILQGKYFDKKPSRPLLEVEFLINEKISLTIFVNHWPSLSNPTEVRLIAAQMLKNRIDELLSKNSSHVIMAVGDFNTIPENYPHPFNSILLKDGVLFDVHDKFMEDRNIKYSQKDKLPPGSYFYGRNMTWNLLDHIFVSSNLLDGKMPEVDLSSYQIYAPKFLTSDFTYKKKGNYLNGSVIKGTPKRYDFTSKGKKDLGFSDHFPVLVKVKF